MDTSAEGAATPVHPPHATRCALIRNPNSRHALTHAQLDGALTRARRAGWSITVTDTQGEGDATHIARGAVSDGVDAIIVHGGDGTINEAVGAMAGTPVALGLIPAGTANVWAGETRIPKEAAAALEVILHGERVRVDLGRAGDRWFLLMAGIGLDALIVPAVSARMKRRLGAASYLVVGAWRALRTKPWHVDMRVDGRAISSPLYWMIVANTRSYGGLTDIMHRAVADDGLLDVGMMRRGGVHRLARDGALVLLKKLERSPNVEYVQARVVEIDTPGIPVQLDGEAAGRTPMRFEVVPRALTVIVPRDLSTPLFSRDVS